MKTSTLALLLLAGLASNAQNLLTYTSADGMASDNCRDVSVSILGGVWIATQNGVSYFDGSTFTNHNTSSHPGLADNSITAIETLSNGSGEVWVGTDFGVSVFNGTSYTTYTTADGLGSNQIKRIKTGPSGEIWIGTVSGATKYENGVFTSYGTPDIPFGGVQDIDFDANGNVYLAGGLSGVTVYDGTNFTQVNSANGLISERTTSLHMDANGNRWVGTDEGITVLNSSDQFIENFTRPFVLPAPDTLNPVTDVAIAPDGMVWAAVYVNYLVTVGGVCYYDGTTWNQLEQSDGLAGPNVRRIDTDPNNGVWVTTSTGLTHIIGVSIGIDEIENEQSLDLYPNPATDQVTIVSKTREQLSIHNMQGQLVYSAPLSIGQNLLDLGHLHRGSYLARSASGKHTMLTLR